RQRGRTISSSSCIASYCHAACYAPAGSRVKRRRHRSCHFQLQPLRNLVKPSSPRALRGIAAEWGRHARLPRRNRLTADSNACPTFMHARDLAELAALVAVHAPVIVQGAGRVPHSSSEQYWAASKCRLDRWGRLLRQLTAATGEIERPA